MELVCAGCNSRFNIPDEKIPRNQKAKVNCPKCKERITIEPLEKINYLFYKLYFAHADKIDGFLKTV